MSYIRTNPCMIEKLFPTFFLLFHAGSDRTGIIFIGGNIDECF